MSDIRYFTESGREFVIWRTLPNGRVEVRHAEESRWYRSICEATDLIGEDGKPTRNGIELTAAEGELS